jgi:hypothetical protein
MGRGGGSSKAGGGGGAATAAAPAPTLTLGGVAVGKLTAAEEDVIDDYSGMGYASINGQARGIVPFINPRMAHLHPDPAKVAAQIATLDGAIAKGKLTVAKTLYRGTQLSVLGDLAVGTVFRDSGFLSTSRSKSVTNNFGHGALLRIKAPKGTRASDVTHHSGGHEQEILLGRNTGLRITKVTQEGGRTVIDVTVVK